MTGAGRWEWEKVVRAARLPMAPALVALTLATYADVDGTKVRPSQSTLAEGLALHRSTVTRAMGRLRDDGYLEQVREPGPGRTAEYRLAIPSVAAVTPKGVTSATKGGHQRHPSVAPVPQHQNKDQNKNQNTYQTSDQNKSGLATAGEEGDGTADPWAGRDDPWELAEALGPLPL